MALSWIYKLWVKLTEVRVPLEGKAYFFQEFKSVMSFHEARDSSLHDYCKNNSKKHLKQFSFNSFPRNEQNLNHVSRSKTSPGCM